MSTFGGAELGCIAAAKVLEISNRPEVRSMVHYIAQYIRNGLEQLRKNYSDFFVGIRQRGVVIGLEFSHPEGAIHVMKALFRNGVWAIFSSLDPKVLQFKPGILVDKELCDEILNRLDTAWDKRGHLPFREFLQENLQIRTNKKNGRWLTLHNSRAGERNAKF